MIEYLRIVEREIREKRSGSYYQRYLDFYLVCLEIDSSSKIVKLD